MKTRILFHYIVAVITYSLVRVPCAALLYGFFHRRGDPETTAHLMRFVDPIVYFPFILLFRLCRFLDTFEATQYVLAAYYIALVIVTCGWVTVAVYRGVRRFLETILQR